MIISSVTPYFSTLFFLHTTPFQLFTILIVDLISIIVLVTASVKFIRNSNSIILFKAVVLLGAVGMVALYCFSVRFLVETGDLLFFKLREQDLNEFVVDIKRYSKINHMSDGESYWKSLNGYQHNLIPNIGYHFSNSTFLLFSLAAFSVTRR